MNEDRRENKTRLLNQQPGFPCEQGQTGDVKGIMPSVRNEMTVHRRPMRR